MGNGPGADAEAIEGRPGRRGINPIRPITLIGVSALGEPGLLVEVEAIAVLA